METPPQSVKSVQSIAAGIAAIDFWSSSIDSNMIKPNKQNSRISAILFVWLNHVTVYRT